LPSGSDKTFYFHAHANSLGGSLETPHKQVAPSQASVALSPVGGHAAIRYPVFPTLDPKLLGVDSVNHLELPIFHKTEQEQAGKMITKAKTHPGKNIQRVTDRFQWMTKPRADSCVLCSLVAGFDHAGPGRAFGHALEIPHFGKIFLGELLVDPSSIQLSMIRAELGCATTGRIGMANATVREGTIPP
jgi:hypothetical protein